MMTVTLVGDRQLVTTLQAMPQKVTASLNKEALFLSNQLRNYIITRKLSGQVLNKRTGNLQRSIKQRVETNPGISVHGYAFSSGDVKYTAIHEFGFSGSQKVKEHVRTMAFGKTVAPFMVPSFTRNVKMPERSFMRSSLKDLTPEIIKGFTRAVMEGAKL